MIRIICFISRVRESCSGVRLLYLSQSWTGICSYQQTKLWPFFVGLFLMIFFFF